jgi:hypothetical protein
VVSGEYSAVREANKRLRAGLAPTQPRIGLRQVARSCKDCGDLITFRYLSTSKPDSWLPHPCKNRARRERVRDWEQRTSASERAERLRQKRLARRSGANAKSRDTAERHGKQWTGPELELAARPDLTARQVAEMTGRTHHAVKTVRKRLQVDPRIIRLAFGGSPTP